MKGLMKTVETSYFTILKLEHLTGHSAISGFPDGSEGEESVCNVGDLGSIPGLGRFLWRREWLPTPVFLKLPDSLVVKTPHFQSSRHWFDPWLRTKIPHARTKKKN